MVRKLGDKVATSLQDRLTDLQAVACLADLSAISGVRPHELKGDRAGQIAVDVTRSVRIVFEPDHEPIQLLPDGGIDRVRVTAITIVYVGDYHE